MKERWIKVTDGWGYWRTMPVSKLPKAEKAYEEMREMAKRANLPQEEIDKYRIVTVEVFHSPIE